MRISRRGFIIASGVVGAGALAAGATQVDWSDLMTAAARNPLSPDAGVLVVCTLYGGNDGLNTVIPASDRAYQSARPDLAYQPHEVLDLGDGLGLNPGMTGLKKLWDDKRLGIVRGVGYPKPDHSHFRSMAIWQTASPGSPQQTGWLGRWLDVTGDDPLRAVSIEPVLPPLMAGQRAAGATLPVTGLKLPTGAVGKAFELMGHPQDGDAPDQARAARSIADLHTTATKLGPAVKPSSDSKGRLAAQLDVVAGLVEAGVPTRAYSVSLGGFDTHADEKGTQQRLLTELDQALSAFVDRMRGKPVVVLVYSEFGRRVGANASDGTDHGTAGPVFVIGDAVRGGFYGEQPSLTDLDNGDLKESTDFRDVYATMLRDVLGEDPGKVLDGHDTTVSGLLG
ncbi:DUF1501 domain-containing protein [Kutzneria kofuensis]|uniref:Uncharacterized protein (DUF1501 family) n=1 Tax=Kutzneria kofuensis TaxID=103725 RepID=A0A7W9NFW4_9PSEU|nr:DUF1501 domain-containing protein [Kutzneria kofuensis]MBB5890468.1 uncharacterized protein (DUF1501 family) [Kutzneria kofuensis]